MSAPLSPEVALLRLAQYGERTSTWSTATYNDGSEKALYEIALTLADRVAELEAERADREDDLAAALGRSGLDWTDLIDVATTTMRRAEGLDATDAAEVDRLTARVSVLEAERHSTNEALSDTAEALREKTQQLADAEQLRLTPLERLTLRFALELVDDAIANDPTDITDADRAAMDKLRALSAGPVVAYRNPWRPGVLLCVEHGEGWEGMKPLSVEDLPNGGTCTAGDPADPDDVCGRDVLATETGERA